MSVRVKICGITTPEQALMVQDAGADLLGLVIYDKSSRYVNVQRAVQIRQVIGPQAQCVALLVNFMVLRARRFVSNLMSLLFALFGCAKA